MAVSVDIADVGLREISRNFGVSLIDGNVWQTKFAGDTLLSTHNDEQGCSVDCLCSTLADKLVATLVVGDVASVVDGGGLAE